VYVKNGHRDNCLSPNFLCTYVIKPTVARYAVLLLSYMAPHIYALQVINIFSLAASDSDLKASV